MKRCLTGLALAAGLFLFLPACTLSGAIDGLNDGLKGQDVVPAPGETGGEENQGALPKSLQERVGDRLFGQASSPEVRAARLDMAVGAYFYLLADRVARFDVTLADEALGRMQALRGVLAARDPALADVFPETTMGEVTIELAAIAVDTGLERFRNLAGLFAGGPNVTGLLNRGRVAARQAFFVDLLLADIRSGVSRMNTAAAEIPLMQRQAAAMMCHSENRVRAVAGAAILNCATAGPVAVTPAAYLLLRMAEPGLAV
jgi:hypothetical protein